MKLFIALFLIASGVVTFKTLNRHYGSSATPSIETEAAKSVGPNATAVVVELFTSEGCSSCPPADEVLSKLDKTQPVQGIEVIALGEHVDYWNKLGWLDPYSSMEFSTRQNGYAEVFGRNGVYTPQMIVDGQDEFVGGNLNRAREAIMKAARLPKAKIELLSSSGSNESSKDMQLSIHIRDIPQVTTGDTAEILLAITESNLRSEVSRGENAGRYLRHSAVVRSLAVLGNVSAGQQSFDAESTATLKVGWQRDNLRAVVFIQERGTRRVLGAAALGLSKN